MLSEILQVMRRASQALCAETLGRELNKDPAVVAAMFEQLVKMGKLQVEANSSTCEACSLKALCGLPPPSDRLYRLSREGENPDPGASGA